MNIKLVLGVASLTFLCDQASKIYVVHFLDLKNRFFIDVINPLINFKMAWNKGINFGLLASEEEYSRWILIVLSLSISLGLLWWIRKSINAIRQFCVALIVGGALGNAIDRVFFGAVADFLNVSCCGIQNPFSFNLADIAIFLGAFALIVWDKNENEVT